jgi:acetylornithine/succinyldiaminopimelate/putrescine aminotransferase
MLGFELAQNIPAFSQSQKSHSIQFVNRLHEAGILTIPAGNQVIRLLPPLNLSRREAEEGVKVIESVIKQLAA